jgi:hypothetical protein
VVNKSANLINHPARKIKYRGSKGDPMKPCDRVLAALNRQPVDRIPYCEHLVDTQVALSTLGRVKSLLAFLKVAQKFGVRNTLKVLGATRDPVKMMAHPETMALAYRMMGVMEPFLWRPARWT